MRRSLLAMLLAGCATSHAAPACIAMRDAGEGERVLSVADACGGLANAVDPMGRSLGCSEPYASCPYSAPVPQSMRDACVTYIERASSCLDLDLRVSRCVCR